MYIIDDDDALALALRIRLESAGMVVTRFDRGVEGVAGTIENPPDCLVLDLRMPGIDGFEVLRRLRADERTASTPIIVLSANVQDDACQRALEGGADRFVGKPYQASQLIAMIQGMCTRSGVA